MARRRRRRREVQEEQEVEVAENDGEEEEEKTTARRSRRRRARTVEEEPVEEADSDEDEEPEEESYEDELGEDEAEPQLPKRREATSRRERVIEQSEATGGYMMQEFMLAMEQGKWLVIGRTGAGEWKLSLLDNLPLSNKERKSVGQEYWDEVLHPDYIKFEEEWRKLDYEDKLKVAEEENIEWDDRGDPAANMMQIVPKLRKKRGIKKYKPEYATREARRVAREKAKMGII